MSNPKREEITLKITDYLDKAFDIIPSNAFIHKGRTGIGGTHLELKAKRNSILVVPTKGIITDKVNAKDKNGNLEYPNLFPVMGGVNINDIMLFLSSNVPNKKLITTPDSLYKIIKAASGNTDKLYADYFLLYDESHSIITESYRESMIKAFEEQFNFKERSFISATPYYFTDPRMEKLDYYKIVFNEPLGKVTIVNAASVKACVNEFLTIVNQFENNFHIFYNSVTEIAEAIKLAGIKDCNVHCSEKEENIDKIGQFFNPQPIKGQYKKINFYTTSHFEGWNLEDINPIIIFVTDVHKEHTKVGISNKGVQAIGRQRIDLNNKQKTIPIIFHITNHRNKAIYKTMERIKNDYLFEAEWDIDEYNRFIDVCNSQECEPTKEKTDFVQRYATINTNTGKAEICHTKIDQFINESACNEEFNHIDYINAAWQKAGYETEVCVNNNYLNRSPKRKTVKSVKEILADFEQLESNNIFYFGQSPIEKLKNKYPNIYKAYKELSKEEIESTGYSTEGIDKLLILKNNKDAEIRVLKLLPHYFTVGQRYTKEYIKQTLQWIYDEAGYKAKATAEDINCTWYDSKSCKIKNKAGNYDNGFEILRPTFKVLAASK